MNSLRDSYTELILEASRKDEVLKTKIEFFVFETLGLRKNSKEAIAILNQFTNIDIQHVRDCITWYSKNAHKNYDAKKGKVSKFFIACITNYLEQKKPVDCEVNIEQQQNEYLKQLELLDESK